MITKYRLILLHQIVIRINKVYKVAKSIFVIKVCDRAEIEWWESKTTIWFYDLWQEK